MALKCKCHLDENRAYHLDKRNQQIFLRETEQECGGFVAPVSASTQKQPLRVVSTRFRGQSKG
jgi:hypothetical protein